MDAAGAVDSIQLNFSPAGLNTLNVILGIIIYGIALGIKVDDFRRVLRNRRAFLIGVFAQFFALPALTFLLIQLIRPAPSIALGMMLVAACPGGNISNFLTSFANGNSALSVSMSAVSTLAAIVMTPLNLAFWGSLDQGTAQILRAVHLNPLAIVLVVGLILGLPLVLGMLTRHHFPAFAAQLIRPFQWFSMIFFLGFIITALAVNFDNFLAHIGVVALIVFLHNSGALLAGFALARAGGLQDYERRAVTIEVGIQNSGLALVLIFDFFAGLGGMALVAAWWGIWHVISGASLAAWWRNRPLKVRLA